MKDLFDYIPEIDVARMKQLESERAAQVQEVRRIDNALMQLRTQEDSLRAHTVQRRARAAAVALGEAVPLAPYEGLTLQELADIRTGLEQRKVAADREQGQAKAALLHEFYASIKRAANAAAEDYVAAASILTGTWQAIGQAQALLGRGGDSSSLVSSDFWPSLRVPSAHGLPAVQKASHVFTDGEYVAHGDRDGVHVPGQAEHVLWRLASAVGAEGLI